MRDPEASEPGERSVLRGGWLYWAVIFAAWTLIGVFFATRPYVRALSTGQPVPGLRMLIPSLADAYTWALFTPPILRLADVFRFRRDRWAAPLLVHLAAGAVFATASVAVNVGVERLLHPEEATSFPLYFAATFHFNLQWYAVIVGIGHALDYYRKYRNRELRASQLETQLARAELQALKMQIQPHFLFNTLNTISELIHEDPEAADRMISRLGDLLRLSMDLTGSQEVPLRQELDFLSAYLGIEQTRFRDRLTVTMDIQPDTLDAQVPNLILQPLVENAIRHGIAPRRAPGSVGISAVREQTALCLRVRDNGAGLPDAPRGPRRGVGLQNVQARLHQLYGPSHHFELRNAEGGGVIATILIPFREAVG